MFYTGPAALAGVTQSGTEPILRIVELAVLGIEILAVIIVIVAITAATIHFVRRRLAGAPASQDYQYYRTGLARAILLGLEVLIAADVVWTVILDSNLDSVLILGLLILLRTFLSWSLVIEIEERWPWQRRNRPTAPETEE